MSQHQPATRTQPSRAARLKALAARPALIALMAAGLIAGSARHRRRRRNLPPNLPPVPPQLQVPVSLTGV